MKNSFVGELYELKKWLTIKHHIPGRIRLKFDLRIVTQIGKFNHLKSEVDNFSLIKDYRLNLVTGSLLLEYDENIIPPQLMNDLLSENEEQSLIAYQQLSSIIKNAYSAMEK